jgi:hypothetical protein
MFQDMTERKQILESIVLNINFDYDNCISWIYKFEGKFGYITMAQYIRIIESKSFHRMAKDDLLMKAMAKMDFGCYENFFVPSKNIPELYQKIFMLIMIEYLFDYMSSRNNKLESYIVWEVIARYFIEEHQRLSPYEFDMNNSNEHSSIRKIYNFFLSKNIDLQEKMNYHTQHQTLFEGIINYFYQVRNYSKMIQPS